MPTTPPWRGSWSCDAGIDAGATDAGGEAVDGAAGFSSLRLQHGTVRVTSKTKNRKGIATLPRID
jgi:hypothetical protein